MNLGRRDGFVERGLESVFLDGREDLLPIFGGGWILVFLVFRLTVMSWEGEAEGIC